MPAENDHYFETEPRSPSDPTSIRLTLPDLSIDLRTDRGVFSAGRVDPGTRLLLSELPKLPDGPVIDVGCGYGPIATTLAIRRPGQPIWAVDVNQRALELCRANLERHAETGTGINVMGPGQVPDEVRFTAIVSNPPIRIGKQKLHGVLDHWMDRLVPHGEAWLVVHRHLGADSLARWLTERGHSVERVRSRQGYRILRVFID